MIEPPHECDNCSRCLSEGCKCCSVCRMIKLEKEKMQDLEEKMQDLEEKMLREIPGINEDSRIRNYVAPW